MNILFSKKESFVNLGMSYKILRYLSARMVLDGGVFLNGKLTKPLSRGAQYVTLQKHFSHPSLVIYFFFQPHP
jgi:hypothetical protein